MKENSIEEDIKIALDKFSDNRDIDSAILIVEKFILGNYILLGGRGNIVKDSLRYILLDYKRVLKENEELKEYNMTYKRILGLADNRIYRKKYLEERRKEQPNLLYPDSDEIYRRYYELKEENEHLHREINRRIKLKIENKKIVDTQLKVLHELLDESEENKCGTN